jgi:hypothetical protein
MLPNAHAQRRGQNDPRRKACPLRKELPLSPRPLQCVVSLVKGSLLRQP